MRLFKQRSGNLKPHWRCLWDTRRLAGPELRQGIKEFSDWPTIPQLCVKCEFIGGCDILREMYTSGELFDLMEEKGVAAASSRLFPEKPINGFASHIDT